MLASIWLRLSDEQEASLRSLIERSGRYRVVLTRDDDEFIRLRDRIAFARRLGGQIFISIHADSLRYTEQRGASIYTLSEQASDAEAASLAMRQKSMSRFFKNVEVR